MGRRATPRALWSDEKKQRHRESVTRSQLQAKLKRYGITVEQYHEILEKTHCESCGREFESSRDRHIDHDHVTGQYRGTLCRKCNWILGAVEDDGNRLLALTKYLSTSPR